MKASPPSSAYILAGPELGKRAAFVDSLKAGCAALDGAPPEFERLYSSETSVDQLLGILRSGSLFSSRRIVEYRGAETISAKAGIDALCAYLAAPSPEAILLLVSDGYNLPKAIESAVGNANKKIFWELRESEKQAWVKTRLASDDLSADDEAVEAFLEIVENETSAMESACLGLAACFPPGTRIDAERMEAALSRSKREDAFSIFDQMAEGSLARALSTLEAVLADRQSDPAQILSAIIWSFRRLRRIQDQVARGESVESALASEKILSKTSQRVYRSAMRRYSASDCASIVRGASETEAALRGGYPASYARAFLQLLLRSAMAKQGGGLILSGWEDQGYYLSD
ncbi:MAG TPA: DNA polymerase III subunit delta [Rectinemataceae bacterium]